MTPEYFWAIGGVCCLITLFVMIALGSAASKKDSLDQSEFDDDFAKGTEQ